MFFPVFSLLTTVLLACGRRDVPDAGRELALSPLVLGVSGAVAGAPAVAGEIAAPAGPVQAHLPKVLRPRRAGLGAERDGRESTLSRTADKASNEVTAPLSLSLPPLGLCVVLLLQPAGHKDLCSSSETQTPSLLSLDRPLGSSLTVSNESVSRRAGIFLKIPVDISKMAIATPPA